MEICEDAAELHILTTSFSVANPVTITSSMQDMPNSIIRSMIGKLKLHHVEHIIKQFLSAAKQYQMHLCYNSKKHRPITVKKGEVI